jgi:hypothetical protein
VLVALLAFELWWIDGGPIAIIDRGRALATALVSQVSGR